ncbi:penicillin-binding protein [Candidatus Dojkabacteria bacterium]|uniref:peptidoglycan glycosyltransferase n=1 Tax=Candidatus Dojkabacteria bacterium TaxID=2099670 RepID=A0A955L3P8_9BACT|nr:penicillin-binding protein [Candidatus Dojkabacteria bacterium]
MDSKRFNKAQKTRRKKVYYTRKKKYTSNRWKKTTSKSKKNSKLRKIVKRGLLVVFVLGFILTLGTVVTVLATVGKYTAKLPTEDTIRAKYTDQWTNSKFYDRNGKLLYEARDTDKTREYVKIDDVPPQVKWMVLAAEDKDFYTHKGFDYPQLAKSGLCYVTREVFSSSRSGTSCAGGSTLTQQLMKNWFVGGEKSMKRKIEEAMITMRTEQSFSKDEIVEAYLNTAEYGGTNFGIKTAARAYFDKDLSELNLTEAAILAAIPNRPGAFSVPFGPDPESARTSVDERKNIILDRYSGILDRVNNDIEDESKKITKEDIEKAKTVEVVYKRGDIEGIKAPQFARYVENALQAEPFAFTLSEINGGGYKIYTSLDLDIQEIAEEEVKKAVDDRLRPVYGQHNAAMIVINPNTGEILAYVGSKDYYGDPEGCRKVDGVEKCKFDPQVDILVSRNAAGSSLKPLVSLTGFENGSLHTSSFLPDIPMQFGSYKPTNYDGGYMGPMKLRKALLYSRNVPFIQAVQVAGVDNFLDKMEQFGYSIDGERSNYGPAVALGAIDIRLLDHVFAYGIFANEGVKMPRTSIIRIEDKDGKEIYKYSKGEGERVASEESTYLVSNMLGDRNYLNFGYIQKFINDGFWAGKTGTSDFHKDTYFMGYSPEVAVGIWSGNNDNSDSADNSSGSSTVLPLWNSFMKRIAEKFPHTQLRRPAGIVTKSVCSDSGLLATDSTKCQKEQEVFISDKLPEEDKDHQVLTVCKDQQTRLARDIDISTGNSIDKTFVYLHALNPDWQKFVDAYYKTSGDAIPKDYCTIDRNPNNDNKPWVVFESPTTNQKVTGNSLKIKFKGYSSANVVRMDAYFDGTLVGTTETDTFDKTITIDSGKADGSYQVMAKIYDSDNKNATQTVAIELKRGVAGSELTLNLQSPSNGDVIVLPYTIKAKVGGDVSSVEKVNFYAKRSVGNKTFLLGTVSTPDGSGVYSLDWGSSAEYTSGNYELYAILVKTAGGTMQSNIINVTVGL